MNTTVTKFIATIKWLDTNEIQEDLIFKVGDFEQEEDDDVSFYLESEKEIEGLKVQGVEDFIILKAVKITHMKKSELLEEVRKACNIIENVDEVVTNNINTCEYASEDFKTNQRISNALLNVIRAMDTLKYEV